MVITLKVYGPPVSVPTKTPSTRRSTLVTPTLSLAETEIFRFVGMPDPELGEVIIAVGAMVSAVLLTVTLVLAVALFPAESLATAANV